MPRYSRRETLAGGATVAALGVAGCTDLFVNGPDPELTDMQQGFPDPETGTVPITLTVENQGSTGDIEVEARALDADGEIINSTAEVIEIEEDSTGEITLDVEANEETDEFEAVAEPV